VLSFWDGLDLSSGEKIMNGTSAAVNHAEKEHCSLPQVAEWLRKAAMKKQAKQDKAAAAAASLTNVSCTPMRSSCFSVFLSFFFLDLQDMKSSGLDGWVRTVDAGDARPSSVNGGMPQWKFASPQHQRLTRACCDFLVLDGQPVSAVEGHGFLQLLDLLEPRFVPPSRTYMQEVCFSESFLCNQVLTSESLLCCFVQTYIPELYWKTKEKQKSMLHDEVVCTTAWDDVEAEFSSHSASSTILCPNPLHPMSLTTDLWTGPDHESYICLTCHHFDINWIFKSWLLDIYLCTNQHTGENLCEWIKQVLSDNEISVRLKTQAPNSSC
jgi:hypothetical protein